MTLAIRSFPGPLGAEVTGLDLEAEIADVAFWRLRGAFLDHAVVVLRDQPAPDAGRVADLAARLGAGGHRHARDVDPGDGDALFANLYRAYATLPAALRQAADGQEGIYSCQVRGPLVRLHPETRRKVLFVGRKPDLRIAGLAEPQSDRIVADLIAHATAPENLYRHRWRDGDLVFWDDRCTILRTS